MLAFTPTTAPKVADALGIDPRSARRLLAQLTRAGWLARSDGHRRVYAPTLRIVALAAQVGTHSPLAVLTAPAVEQLHAQAGVVSVLAVPGYDGTVCLVRANGGMATMPSPAAVTPARSCAAGMVLLAHREAWRERVLSSGEPGERQRLEEHLAQVRAAGYASNDGVGTGGCREIAAPVFGPGGEVLAAVAAVFAAGERAHVTAEHVAQVRQPGSRPHARCWPARRGIRCAERMRTACSPATGSRR